LIWAMCIRGGRGKKNRKCARGVCVWREAV